MGKSLIPAQRRQKIRQWLEVQGVAQIAALAEALGVSPATIRRDLLWLERTGVTERTHGGAILSQRLPTEPAYERSARTRLEEKRAIARRAAQLIEPGDSVFLNSGTTATELMRALRVRAGGAARETGLSEITVVTNNVTAALEAQQAGVEVILIGGLFRPISHSLVGRFAVETLRRVYADKAFLGVDGISLKFGCTTPVSGEAEVARQMIEHTRGATVIVADHSKWGVVSNFPVASLDEVDILVVDDGLAPQWRQELEARRVRVLLAGREAAGEAASAGAREVFAAP